LAEKPSIAVLPFANMSGDPEQEYFADGIAEDVTTLLSKSRALFVIARNSSFTYKGRAVDVKQVGRELGVCYMLEGSVRKAGYRVRVIGQLIEAATGGHLCAERYDRDLTDIFADTTRSPPASRRRRPSIAASASAPHASRPTTSAPGNAITVGRGITPRSRLRGMRGRLLASSARSNSTPAHGYQGATRAFGGRPRDAIEPLDTAMRLSPFDPFRPDWLHYIGRACYCMGD
jgi:TolB-like protein